MALLDHQPFSEFEDTLHIAEDPPSSESARDRAAQPSSEQGLRVIPARLRTLTRGFIVAALAYMTFAFGGVHAVNYLSFQALLFALLAGYLLICPAALYNGVVAPLGIGGTSRTAGGPILSRTITIFLAAICAYPALQWLVLSLRTEVHPVLGSAGGPLNRGAFFEQWIFLGAFTGWFVLLTSFLKDSPRRARMLFRTLCGLTFAVSITALMHWFYDNGKLFWVFAPDYVFLSHRSRWPFVNSNHLAHFILPGLFALAGWLTITAQEIGRSIQAAAGRDRRKFNSLITSSALQNRLILTGFLITALAAAIMCLVSSLSRGAWFGAVAGGLVFLWLGGSAARSAAEQTPQQVMQFQRARHQHRGGSRSDHNFGRLIGFLWYGRVMLKPLLLLVLGIFVYLFFNERGSELFAERLDYGLLHSKDDMRWVMFSDSLRMLWAHPWIGVGLGGWSSAYPAYMDALLSGINPVYLHSDPLQLLCETGLLGGLLMLGLCVSLIAGILRALPRAQGNNRIKLASLAAGLVALTVASFFDFSFHIPAISLVLGAYLALTVFYVERAWITKLR